MFKWLQGVFRPEKSSSSVVKSVKNSVKSVKNVDYDLFDIDSYDSCYNSPQYYDNVVVYRAINTLVNCIINPVWHVVKKDSKAVLLDELLKRPNSKQSWQELLQAVMINKVLFGNAYVYCPDNSSLPIIYNLRPDRVRIVQNKDGIPEYYEYVTDRKIYRIPYGVNSRILHLKYFSPYSEYYGVSPLKSVQAAIVEYNAISAHNMSLIKNGGRPAGCVAIKNQYPLSVEQKKALRDDIDKIYKGPNNAGNIFIAEGDIDWKEIGKSPKELDFYNSKILAAREIAQALGVPFCLFGLHETTFSNYIESRLYFWEDVVCPSLNRVIGDFNCWLQKLYSTGSYFDYDKDNIHALMPKREKLWAMMNNADFLTLNEKRSVFGYPNVKNGDAI